MLYCRRCGQNKHISEENFIAYRAIHGSELVYIDCEDANNIVDYGDSDTDSDGINDYTCPTCDSQDVDTDWEDDEENVKVAEQVRESYDLIVKQRNEERENKRKEKERWDE